MSDTGGFPLVGGSPAFPGKNNVVRDSSGSNSFGWENLNVGNLSVVGGYRNKVTGSNSYSYGSRNTVSGNHSFAIGSAISVSGDYSSAHGKTITITGNRSLGSGEAIVIGGSYSFASGTSITASGTYSLAFGVACVVSGNYSLASGYTSTASENFTYAFGALCLASRYGEFAQGGYNSAETAGAVQRGSIMLSIQSSSATPLILYADGTVATKRPIMAAGTRWKCTLEIMAATTGAIDKSASWEYKFQIDRPTTAATTIIRTTPLLTLSDGSNAGAPPAGWSVSITADTTNGCPQIQVTGDTDTINWTAALHYVQSIRV